MTIQALADEYGEIAAQIKALQSRQDEIKKKLSTYKSDEFVGITYTIKRSVFERTGLNVTAIKADMTAKWIAKYTTVTTATRLTVSLSAPELDLAA